MAGLHLCALADGLGPGEIAGVVERAAERGVALFPRSQFTADPARRVSQTGLVLGYGAIPIERIHEGLHRLAECLPQRRVETRPFCSARLLWGWQDGD